MDEQRIAELEELAKARKLTNDERRELDDLLAGEQVTGLKLAQNVTKITGLKLTNSETGEVTEWKPEQD